MTSIPWIEKYRPKSLDQVEHQDSIVNTLKTSLETGHLPHLLFYGPPGTGKTSAITALARQLFPGKLYSKRVKELNASDERGIKIVQSTIKTFASFATGKSVRPDGTVVPGFKIIILDEADAMTSVAQAALRRIIENYSNVTRFCLICNYVTRIIDPIASRCAIFRFQPLSISSISSRLNYIATQEGVHLAKDCIPAIVKVSKGDLRKAIVYLQSAYDFTTATPSDPITSGIIYDLAGAVPPSVVEGLISATRKNTTVSGAWNYADNAIILDGYPVPKVIQLLNSIILWDETDELMDPDLVDAISKLSDAKKSELSFAFAQASNALIRRGSETTQLLLVLKALIEAFR